MNLLKQSFAVCVDVTHRYHYHGRSPTATLHYCSSMLIKAVPYQLQVSFRRTHDVRGVLSYTPFAVPPRPFSVERTT